MGTVCGQVGHGGSPVVSGAACVLSAPVKRLPLRGDPAQDTTPASHHAVGCQQGPWLFPQVRWGPVWPTSGSPARGHVQLTVPVDLVSLEPLAWPS